MTTRDEAKKMAEEYAATQLAKTTGYTREDLVTLRLWTIDTWMACYDAMTKGEPDGYCAWHPDKGLIVETTDPRESETVLSLRKMMIHPQSLTLANIAVVEKLGYQVVPVKLIVCEDK